jgi:hypothetical protein
VLAVSLDFGREDNLGIEERLERASRRMAGIAVCVFGVLAIVPLEPAAAHHQWTFKTIYQFCQVKKCHDGGAPTGPLLVDRQGNLYGATTAVSPRQEGMIFELVRGNGNWKYHILHRFCADDACKDDCGPRGGLIMDTE